MAEQPRAAIGCSDVVPFSVMSDFVLACPTGVDIPWLVGPRSDGARCFLNTAVAKK
jgi:hypothetical protein